MNANVSLLRILYIIFLFDEIIFLFLLDAVKLASEGYYSANIRALDKRFMKYEAAL